MKTKLFFKGNSVLFLVLMYIQSLDKNHIVPTATNERHETKFYRVKCEDIIFIVNKSDSFIFYFYISRVRRQNLYQYV